VFLTRDKTQETMSGTSYLFPQATRNFVMMVDFKL
jgi:hypothetical protein